jgi:glycosyltransferase involved in cell wall biosynthesis
MIEVENKPCFSLIMPILNEGNRIIPTIATLGLTINYPFELIIIYDKDTDITLPVIRELKKQFNFIRLKQNEDKRVIGAIKTGFENATTEIVGIWLPYHVDPFGLINQMYEKIINENCVLVSGNRFNKIKRISRGNPLKKILSRAGNYFLNRLIGIPLGDITTSIKLYQLDFIKNTPIETEISGGWSLNTELAVKAAIKGVKLGEIEFLPENTNIINGVSNFKVFKQLDYYLKWLFLGYQNRKLIKKNYSFIK